LLRNGTQIGHLVWLNWGDGYSHTANVKKRMAI
jgi:hypothetical protein